MDLVLIQRKGYILLYCCAGKEAVTFNGLCLALFQQYLYYCHCRFNLGFVAMFCNYDKVIIEVHIALGFVDCCTYWRRTVCVRWL